MSTTTTQKNYQSRFYQVRTVDKYKLGRFEVSKIQVIPLNTPKKTRKVHITDPFNLIRSVPNQGTAIMKNNQPICAMQKKK